MGKVADAISLLAKVRDAEQKEDAAAALPPGPARTAALLAARTARDAADTAALAYYDAYFQNDLHIADAIADARALFKG